MSLKFLLPSPSIAFVSKFVTADAPANAKAAPIISPAILSKALMDISF